MAGYQTQYTNIPPYDDDDEDDTGEDTDNHVEAELLIHVVPEGSKARWNHIENLDDFFTRVYHYHQRQGFLCMVLEDVLQLVQFVFVALFSTFLIKCVDYDILFANVTYNTTHKVTISEAVIPTGQCIQSFDFPIVFCLLMAFIFWLLRAVKVLYNIFLYYEIRSFYATALKISARDLPNMTWHEVQTKLLDVQKEQQMCIHKIELTQLDIYHRILRFKNYTIAMVNKNILPLKYDLPFTGEYVFLSTGLKYNMEFLLYWGPWSAFENKWHLKEEYKEKSPHRRKQLAEYLSKRILWLGLANLAFSPLIFLWQILYFFFRYAELVKRQPAFLGSRRWFCMFCALLGQDIRSNYGRQYLRHFNELDHEFSARLNRGYSSASMYLNIFTSPLLTLIAKNVAFFAGSILAVLVVLTVIDEDVLNVEHVFTIATIAGVIVTSCKVFIPDENAVYCPEVLMRAVLSQIHYMPDHWAGNAHTHKVRDEFSLLFQFKAVYLLEELFSPLITPFILCVKFREKAQEIVEFFHNFTVEVVGVGDVCSFAQMDIRKHGNPTWSREEVTEASMYEQGENGKIEMSLMHFHLTNPEWKPPDNCSMFLTDIKEQVHHDAMSMSTLQPDITGGGFQSLGPGMMPSGATGIGLGEKVKTVDFSETIAASDLKVGRCRRLIEFMKYASLMSSVTGQSAMMSPSVNLSMAPFASGVNAKFRGAVSQCEGPMTGSGSRLISSGSGQEAQPTSFAPPPTLLPLPPNSLSIQGTSLQSQPTSVSTRMYDEGQLEMLNNEMSFSALYMHDLRTRRLRAMSYESMEDIRARALWQRPDSAQVTPSGVATPMPNIQEEESAMDVDSRANTSKQV